MYRPAHDVLFDRIDQLAEQMIQLAESGDAIGVKGELKIFDQLCLVIEEMIVPEPELSRLVGRLNSIVLNPRASDCPSLVARIRTLAANLEKRFGKKILLPYVLRVFGKNDHPS